ncbi:tyrosine-type recombinase/integrase [Streptomyces sp. NBC_00094]|uniref:tyrosine-type recombinase/integrase n=1 Tax=Streptomyces sp. NBC_00094 TaxID=2903620 RepID=UPI0022538636|nr:tyrosine-type recombinase/integrase [Streptomyces sp. NBC_00094]MCX5395224.1 tyrosine-type recombinase/integrase [Streptomyces sp. NBC_00094]
MRAFAVTLPSGQRYWTVLDESLVPVAAADRFLRHVRFGKNGAESTTETYAYALALFLRWCARTDRDWRTAAPDLGLFMTWLRYAPKSVSGVEPSLGAALMLGPGAKPARSEKRVNAVLTAVRGMVAEAVTHKDAPGWVLPVLFDLASTADLPAVARGENAGTELRLGARHRMKEPKRPVDRASDEEIVALLRACRSARDRLMILLMARSGLRRGELVGLRREDMHFLLDSSSLGCQVSRAHLHVVRRELNPNGAWAKSRRERVVPVDGLLVRAHDHYAMERLACRAAAACDFVLVNLFRAPLGAPMPPRAVNELLTALSERAGLARRVRPHQLRHAFASNARDAGAEWDELSELMGHESPESLAPYLHPDPQRLRAAVERVPSPRLLDTDTQVQR